MHFCCATFQFVTEGLDQSIKSLVEYCVVCGDKASGEIYRKKLIQKIFFKIFPEIYTSFTHLPVLSTPLFRASLWSCEL